ncbi:MAG: DUF4118 domain-containing protein [Vicinamibacterales bacterium]
MTAVAVVTLLFISLLRVNDPATVSTTFMLVVLLVAAVSELWSAVTVSVIAVLFFNYFFLPPVRTFTIADPQNWVALFAFLVVSLVASNLSARVRTREREALVRRDELARLFDLSRDVLMMTDSRDALLSLARSIGRRFDLECVALALPSDQTWNVFSTGPDAYVPTPEQLGTAFGAAKRSIEFDATTRSYAGHELVTIGDRLVDIVPLRSDTKPIGLLATSGRHVEAGTLDALAGIAAIAIERARFLEERKVAELTRQSEELKTALLASISHDLRTPLTAIRLAASNIKDASLSASQRDEQADLVMSEAARLGRLFQNILEMARLDAGAITTQRRRTHPSEIIEGAREQAADALRDHNVITSYDGDIPVSVDPRLMASALAHVLENAAQYSAAGTTIEISAAVNDDGLSVRVRDHGPGISAADLPHLFERFYRGASGAGRRAGTGVGLWIANGLVSALGGRIRADNCVDGGSQFSLLVPVQPQSERTVEATSLES